MERRNCLCAYRACEFIGHISRKNALSRTNTANQIYVNGATGILRFCDFSSFGLLQPTGNKRRFASSRLPRCVSNYLAHCTHCAVNTHCVEEIVQSREKHLQSFSVLYREHQAAVVPSWLLLQETSAPLRQRHPQRLGHPRRHQRRERSHHHNHRRYSKREMGYVKN